VDRLVGSPREARLRPDSAPGAQFSLPYTVAAALRRGRLFLEEIAPEAYTSESILALAEKVFVEPDPAMRTDLVVGRTEIEIEADGRPAWRQAVDHPLGGATRPLSAEACRQKFMAAAEGAVNRPDPARLERLVAQAERLESLDDVSGLPRLLA
jgi:2-methylcitrate dehydratase PrpD